MKRGLVKRDVKKLSLHRETIVELGTTDLGHVAGASQGWSECSVCPSTTPSDCRSCY